MLKIYCLAKHRIELICSFGRVIVKCLGEVNLAMARYLEPHVLYIRSEYVPFLTCQDAVQDAPAGQCICVVHDCMVTDHAEFSGC